MKVASAGIRAAQPQHRLLLRRTHAGDGRLALEPGHPQCIQGLKSQLPSFKKFVIFCPPFSPESDSNSLWTFSLEKKKFFIDFQNTLVMSVLLWQQVGQGLSRDGKALKLAFQHWIEAVSTTNSHHPTNTHVILFSLIHMLGFGDVLSCVSKQALQTLQYRLTWT